MLLIEQQIVVYLIRTEMGNSRFYEFKYDKASDSFTAKVYPEGTNYSDIVSLDDPSTFYVVDSWTTRDSVTLRMISYRRSFLFLRPMSAIGENHVSLSNAMVSRACFEYFPLWSCDELLTAGSILGPARSVDEIHQHYRRVGGVPEHVFADDHSFENALVTLARAFAALSVQQAMCIEDRRIALDSKYQPKSAIMGYQLSADDNGQFSKAEAVKDLWQANYFSTQIVGRFSRPTPVPYWLLLFRKSFKVRPVLDRPIMFLKVGGCPEIRLVHDIIDAAKKTPNVLFYPMDDRTNLLTLCSKMQVLSMPFKQRSNQNTVQILRILWPWRKKLVVRISCPFIALSLV